MTDTSVPKARDFDDSTKIYVPKEGISGLTVPGSCDMVFEYNLFITWSDCVVEGTFHFQACGPVVMTMTRVKIGKDCIVEPKGTAILILDSSCEINGKLVGWSCVAKRSE